MYEALLYLLSVPVKVVANAAGNEALRRTQVRDTVGLRSTRIAQRGESGHLAGACLFLKSNYVGRVSSLPSDGDLWVRFAVERRNTQRYASSASHIDLRLIRQHDN
jgi:hypothetical protein